MFLAMVNPVPFTPDPFLGLISCYLRWPAGKLIFNVDLQTSHTLDRQQSYHQHPEESRAPKLRPQFAYALSSTPVRRSLTAQAWNTDTKGKAPANVVQHIALSVKSGAGAEQQKRPKAAKGRSQDGFPSSQTKSSSSFGHTCYSSVSYLEYGCY